LKKRQPLPFYIDGILQQNRVVLGQAITLLESHLPEDEPLALQLMDQLLPHTGHSLRVGITGVPGVGKSTFIESFGKHVIDAGKNLAVLTIDPSSQRTHGSILGDKTRMELLSKNPRAFIRPSASGTVLGGVAHKTREAMLLCEAAGFDVVVVETVGTGQSETSVNNMVDFFLLLMLAGAGDELQGIKKGIMEMADAVVITKADGENKKHASQAAADYAHALHLLQPPDHGWLPQVLTCSALENTGIDAVWKAILKFEEHAKASGYFVQQRNQQKVQWMEENFNGRIQSSLRQSPVLQQAVLGLKNQLLNNQLSVLHASQKLFELLKKVDFNG
jgi:LAO/AO transport system kinase